jgi:hypothetical protein
LQPLAGWRHVKVTDQRTKQDFAWCMQDLVEIHFPEAEMIRVVLDNLDKSAEFTSSQASQAGKVP